MKQIFTTKILVQKYKRGEFSSEEVKVEIMDVDKLLESDRLFVRFLVRGQVNASLSDGAITQKQVRKFYSAC